MRAGRPRTRLTNTALEKRDFTWVCHFETLKLLWSMLLLRGRQRAPWPYLEQLRLINLITLGSKHFSVYIPTWTRLWIWFIVKVRKLDLLCELEMAWVWLTQSDHDGSAFVFFSFVFFSVLLSSYCSRPPSKFLSSLFKSSGRDRSRGKTTFASLP